MPSNDYSNVIFFCREEGFTPSFTVKVYRFFYFTEDIFLCCLLYSNGWWYAGLVPRGPRAGQGEQDPHDPRQY